MNRSTAPQPDYPAATFDPPSRWWNPDSITLTATRRMIVPLDRSRLRVTIYNGSGVVASLYRDDSPNARAFQIPNGGVITIATIGEVWASGASGTLSWFTEYA